MKPERMGLAGKKISYNVLVGKPKRKPLYVRGANIKMDYRYMCYENPD
jgi:hypothetical protein